jgi:hypothetical protein
VTVQEVTELLPELAGARNETVAPASFVIDVTEDGADGGVPAAAFGPRVTHICGIAQFRPKT